MGDRALWRPWGRNLSWELEQNESYFKSGVPSAGEKGRNYRGVRNAGHSLREPGGKQLAVLRGIRRLDTSERLDYNIRALESD